MKRCVGQRAVSDELALRDEHHAGDGEHQDEGQRQQGVDGAVDDAVLQQDQEYVEVHQGKVGQGKVGQGKVGAPPRTPPKAEPSGAVTGEV